MYQCRFINKCTSFVGHVNKGESYAGRECVRISLPSTQFCHESNKTLKKKKKNPPCSAGDRSSVPDWGGRIPHATEQVGVETSEPRHHNLRLHKKLATAIFVATATKNAP